MKTLQVYYLAWKMLGELSPCDYAGSITFCSKDIVLGFSEEELRSQLEDWLQDNVSEVAPAPWSVQSITLELDT